MQWLFCPLNFSPCHVRCNYLCRCIHQWVRQLMDQVQAQALPTPLPMRPQAVLHPLPPPQRHPLGPPLRVRQWWPLKYHLPRAAETSTKFAPPVAARTPFPVKWFGGPWGGSKWTSRPPSTRGHCTPTCAGGLGRLWFRCTCRSPACTRRPASVTESPARSKGAAGRLTFTKWSSITHCPTWKPMPFGNWRTIGASQSPASRRTLIFRDSRHLTLFWSVSIVHLVNSCLHSSFPCEEGKHLPFVKDNTRPYLAWAIEFDVSVLLKFKNKQRTPKWRSLLLLTDQSVICEYIFYPQRNVLSRKRAGKDWREEKCIQDYHSSLFHEHLKRRPESC